MNNGNRRDLTHDLVLPTLVFAALGGMVWAIRGCSGFGAMKGCIFAGVTWRTAWWFIARDPVGPQSRRYTSAWIILALAAPDWDRFRRILSSRQRRDSRGPGQDTCSEAGPRHAGNKHPQITIRRVNVGELLLIELDVAREEARPLHPASATGDANASGWALVWYSGGFIICSSSSSPRRW